MSQRSRALLAVALLGAAVGCAPPPIYAPAPHPLALMDEPGASAAVHVGNAGLTAAAAVRGPYGVLGYAHGEFEATDRESRGRDHRAWAVGLGWGHAVPLSAPLRLWVEGSAGLGGGTTETRGQEVVLPGSGDLNDGDIYVNERGGYASRFGTLALVLEQRASEHLRAQVGVTGRAVHLDYDLEQADPDLMAVGAAAAWVVEPGVLLGLGTDHVQVRWRQVWARPVGDVGFGVREGRSTIEVALRVPLRELW